MKLERVSGSMPKWTQPLLFGAVLVLGALALAADNSSDSGHFPDNKDAPPGRRQPSPEYLRLYSHPPFRVFHRPYEARKNKPFATLNFLEQTRKYFKKYQERPIVYPAETEYAPKPTPVYTLPEPRPPLF